MHGFNTKFFDSLSNLNRAFGAYNTLVRPIPEQFLANDSSNIEEGTVDFVNPKDYSCFVTTTSGKQIPDVLFVSPWFCGANGAGFYMYPQVNSKVLISKAKLTNKYYILGFVPILSNAKTTTADDTQYLNGRKTDLTEGDVVLSTEHGPFFKMCNYSRSIHLICDSVCRIQMQTSEHKIFLRSHRLYINTAAGLIQMDTTDEGQTTTVAYFRMKLGDQENFVKAIIGSTGVSVGEKLKLNTDGSRTSTEVIFALNICNKASITIDTEGNVVTYCKSIQNRVVEDVDNIINGKVTSAVQKGVSTANRGDLKIEATGGLAINAGGTLSLSGKESLVAVGKKTTLGSTETMDIVSGSTMTRSSNSNIIDQGTGIQHSSGSAGNIPSLQDVSVDETEIAGIMDTSISDIEVYNPALVSAVPDPTSAYSINSEEGAFMDNSMPVAPEEDPPVEDPPDPPEDNDVRIIAKVSREYYKQTKTSNLCREGTMTLFNSDNSVAGSYYFMNGPWGKGAVPLGTYIVSGGSRTSESAMSVRDSATGKVSGWKFNVSDVYDENTGSDRTALKIHPDGIAYSADGNMSVADMLAAQAKSIALSMGGYSSIGYCARGVKDALMKVKLLSVRPSGNAWQMASVLANNDNFKEITGQFPTKASLVNTPKGSVTVWNKKAGASEYGHISVSLGNGKEASDHVQNTIIDNSNKYGPYRVFMPVDRASILGSDGCFVISGTYNTIEDFYNKLTDILKDKNGQVKMEYRKG